MFGIKKGKEKTNEQTLEQTDAPVRELESFTMDSPVQIAETPVMREDDIDIKIPDEPTVQVTKEVVEDVIKEKKKNVLWAKILVVVILVLTIFLGLYKFADYLNQPKTLFFSVAEETFNDFTTMMGNMQSHNVLSLLSGGTEINADVKITAEDLPTEYEEFESIVNDSSYIFNIEMDRSTSYINANVDIMNDSTEKMNVNFLSSNFDTYFNIPQIGEEFIGFETKNLRITSHEPTKNLALVNIIKTELLNLLEDKTFKLEESAIAVHGKAVDCKKSSFEFTGSDIKLFIDNVLSSVKLNGNAYYYLASLLGTTASDMEVQLNNYKLQINDTDKYEISAYTNALTDNAVRLELKYETTVDGVSTTREMAYNKDLNYRLIEYTVGDIYKLYEIEGNINTSNELTIINNDQVVTLSNTKDGDYMDGTISIVDNKTKEVKIEAKYHYMMRTQSDTSHSMSFSLNATTYRGESHSKFSINASILLNSNIEIEKSAIDSEDTLMLEEMTELEKEDLKTRIKNYILSIDDKTVIEENPDTPSEGELENPDSNAEQNPGTSSDENVTVPDESGGSETGGENTTPQV